MSEEKFSPEQSLRLIESMILKTRKNMSDNSIYFLVWGWLAFIACTLQFILKHVYAYEKHYLVWLLTLVGIGFSIYQGSKTKRTKKVTSYVDDSMRHLWGGMGIAFFVLAMILTRMGWDMPVFPFFIMLYGLGTFVSGRIIQFTPLTVGGLVAFALAVGSTFASYDYQMLFGAAAILASYIIPAHLLRAQQQRQNESIV